MVEETALRLELTNGSRVVSLPGKESTIRGFSGVELLVVDEASRVPDDLYYAVRPMLAVSGGGLVCSPPPSASAASSGTSGPRVGGLAPGQDHGRAMPTHRSHLAGAERAAIGDWWYRQEYGCEFVDAVDAYFRSEVILAMADPTIVPLFASPGRCVMRPTYGISVDLGQVSDFTAIAVLERRVEATGREEIVPNLARGSTGASSCRSIPPTASCRTLPHHPPGAPPAGTSYVAIPARLQAIEAQIRQTLLDAPSGGRRPDWRRTTGGRSAARGRHRPAGPITITGG